MTYKKRYASTTATGLTFIGSGGNATQPPMTGLKTTYGSEILFNRGVYAGSTGTDKIVDDAANQVLYGIRTIVRRNLLNLNDADVLSAATNFVLLYSTPALRVSQLTCMPRSMTEAQAEAVAKLGIWDGIQVSFTPVGADTAQQRIVRIEGPSRQLARAVDFNQPQPLAPQRAQPPFQRRRVCAALRQQPPHLAVVMPKRERHLRMRQRHQREHVLHVGSFGLLSAKKFTSGR